jgi:glycosyltransferase involved in cell wall biosynthesis
MKIAYFTETLPPQTDGVVNTLCRLADTLESEKVDFRFYSPFKPGSEVGWTDRVKRVASMPLPLYDYYRIGLPFLHNLQSDLDAFGPDLVHAVSPTPLGWAGIEYARRRGLPVVTSYHTHFTRYLTYYGLEKAETAGWQYLRWFHNRGRRTYAPTPSAIRELEARGFHSLELWSRGIDLERFHPGRRSEAFRQRVGAGGLPVLLFVGRLVREKDLDDLVRAAEALRGRGRMFRMVFAGDGPMRAELEARLPDARFLGFLRHEALAECYASADLFVFPSTTETFGNVVLEAFASGLPVVAADRGGVADLVSHGRDGFLAGGRDPADFARCIEVLLNDPALRIRFGVEARR